MKIKKIKKIPTSELLQSLNIAETCMSMGLSPDGRLLTPAEKGGMRDCMGQVKSELRRRGEPYAEY